MLLLADGPELFKSYLQRKLFSLPDFLQPNLSLLMWQEIM